MNEQETLSVLDYALEKYNLYTRMAELYRQQYETYVSILAIYEQQRLYIHQPPTAEVIAELHQQHQQLTQQIRQLRAELVQLRQRCWTHRASHASER